MGGEPNTYTDADVDDIIAVKDARLAALEAALLRITSIIETQAEPDIDAMHDVARDALRSIETPKP